jgi:hypothetical protein
MSGGAKVPTAPNLSGNIAAGNNTAATATSDASQTLNTANAYNQNAQSNLSNVTNQANSSAGQLSANATQNLNSYSQNFAPLQQSEAQQATNYGSADNVSRLQGQAVANVAGANQAARANSAQALASEGVDPASVHGAALDRQAGVQGAGQEAAAGTQSAIQTQQTAFGMANTANQLGMQVGAQGDQAAATAAQTAEGGQSSVNQTNQTGIGNLTANTSQLNAGTNANNSAVSANQAQFGDQQTQYTDQNQQNAGTMSAIGSLVGGAAAFMERGGVVPGGHGIHHGIPVPGRVRFPHMVVPAHSGLPVNPNHFAQPPGLPTKFEPMFHGGPVSAKGALPVGSVPGSTDTKPAILTPGEFVVPKDAVDHMGTEYWHKQVDKARETANKRRAIPVPYAPHMSMH